MIIAPQSKPAIAQAEVHAFVARWAQAQSAVDFAAYSSLYAERFTGIKRVGDKKEQTFDRKSWLADRQTMFKPGLKVRADDLRVNVAGTTAQVRFKQSFATDRFSDEGPKELLLISTPDGLRLAREEMLASTLHGNATQRGDAHVLFMGQGRLYLNLGVPDAALTGPLQRMPNPDTGAYAVEQAVDPQALSESSRAWIGKSVEGYSADGTACESKIVSLRARAEVIPHFGQVQYWEGTNAPTDGPKEPKPPQSEVTDAIWAMGSMDGYVLVGVLSAPCPAAFWTSPGHPKPTAFAAEVAEKKLADFLLEALASLPESAEIQKVFEESSTERAKTNWLSAARKSFQAYAPIAGVQTAVASAQVGNGCGDIDESLSVVFELDVRKGTPRVIRKRKLSARGPLQLKTAVDLDADGQLELLGEPSELGTEFSYWWPKGNGFERSTLRRVGFHDCPC